MRHSDASAATRRIEVARSFPSVHLASASDGQGIDVSLIAQLGPGAGNHLIASTGARQRQHEQFIDALQEPSAKLADVDPQHGDLTSLYSFTVGADAHPFHRHAGHRVFTAISGSGGARLRFSTASDAALAVDPQAFVDSLHCVSIPPDCLFTVRFGGGTWHQFAPADARHPALFALSCHTNELGGLDDASLREQVLDGRGSIPGLTELLPAPVRAVLDAAPDAIERAAHVALSFEAPPGSFKSFYCSSVRSTLGRLRAVWARWYAVPGFLTRNGRSHRTVASKHAPAQSLLDAQFDAQSIEHEDALSVELAPQQAAQFGASLWMNLLLEGFMTQQPAAVTRLMALRNALVRPLRLRRSRLACPVSSLLGDSKQRFAQRYPVLDQRVDAADRHCEVLLGADDRHLQFRSSVLVDCEADGRVRITLATRVHCRNLFGRFYMAAIARTHRRYIAPTVLASAVDFAVERSGCSQFAPANLAAVRG